MVFFARFSLVHFSNCVVSNLLSTFSFIIVKLLLDNMIASMKCLFDHGLDYVLLRLYNKTACLMSIYKL